MLSIKNVDSSNFLFYFTVIFCYPYCSPHYKIPYQLNVFPIQNTKNCKQNLFTIILVPANK